jgi:molybdopterin/thiamine biosynthesis adenylyltransferase
MKNQELSEGDERVVIRARSVLSLLGEGAGPTDRQEGVPGFDQERVSSAGVACFGCGGLASEQVVGIVRKGYRRLFLADFDEFEPSNASRQRCYVEDMYQNKAIRLAKSLEREVVLETDLFGYALPFEEAYEEVDPQAFPVWLCNVDNNPTRVEFSRIARRLGVASVIAGVSADASHGYVFVQEAGEEAPCFGCLFPEKVDDETHPCPDTPACVDILKVIGGFVLYAVDSLLMKRARHWNYRTVNLSGFVADGAVRIDKNPNCPLCSGHGG